MEIVTYTEYMADLQAFIKKHSKKYDYKIITSGFDFATNSYQKTYAFENGAMFSEVNEMDRVEEVDVSAHGLTFKTDVHFIRHEYWTTEYGSKYWYEPK